MSVAPHPLGYFVTTAPSDLGAPFPSVIFTNSVKLSAFVFPPYTIESSIIHGMQRIAAGS